MKAPIDGHPDLFKDLDTGVIVNRSSDRERYQIAKRQALATNDHDHELAHLKREIDEIKTLLQQLVNK